jgi:hypothetical protein
MKRELCEQIFDKYPEVVAEAARTAPTLHKAGVHIKTMAVSSTQRTKLWFDETALISPKALATAILMLNCMS